MESYKSRVEWKKYEIMVKEGLIMRNSYPWMEAGEYLTKKHRPSMIKAERFVCNCRKELPWKDFKYIYPACVFEGKWNVDTEIREDLFEAFWESIVREVQGNHPEWVMEAFMLESHK